MKRHIWQRPAIPRRSLSSMAFLEGKSTGGGMDNPSVPAGQNDRPGRLVRTRRNSQAHFLYLPVFVKKFTYSGRFYPRFGFAENSGSGLNRGFSGAKRFGRGLCPAGGARPSLIASGGFCQRQYVNGRGLVFRTYRLASAGRLARPSPNRRNRHLP